MQVVNMIVSPGQRFFLLKLQETLPVLQGPISHRSHGWKLYYDRQNARFCTPPCKLCFLSASQQINKACNKILNKFIFFFSEASIFAINSALEFPVPLAQVAIFDGFYPQF